MNNQGYPINNQNNFHEPFLNPNIVPDHHQPQNIQNFAIPQNNFPNQGQPNLGIPPTGFTNQNQPQPMIPSNNFPNQEQHYPTMSPLHFENPNPVIQMGNNPSGFDNQHINQPPTGFVAQNINPPPQEPETFDNQPFKMKGIVELQKDFNAQEIKIVKKQKHICSFILNFLQFITRGYLLVVIIGYNIDREKFRPHLRLILDFVWILILTEVTVFIELMCSSTLRYLWNKHSSDKIYEYVGKIKNTRPEIYFTCECYHFETRVRYVTEHYTVQGSKGPETRTRQRMETYQEKVVTHRENESFDYQRFFEISPMISDDIYHNDLIKIKFGKKIQFGDDWSRSQYDSQLAYFISRNRNRDTHFGYLEYKEIAGFKDRMFSANGEVHCFLVHWFWYLILSFMGFTWAYRMWLEGKCIRGEFDFHMLVFKNRNSFR